uniref:Membrane-associated protein n=1 Tax=Steinernema glaseri TaxID=37863 RepID=A0A1I7ZZ84_9BILA
MAERTSHLITATYILFLFFLSSTAIVPAPGQCWNDRIFAHSGDDSFWDCDVTKRCVNETFLLSAATRECGQSPEKHTFRERCGLGHYFAIDYTCCAPYQYHEQCLEEPLWRKGHTDKLLTTMKTRARMAKEMQEAKKAENNATADKKLIVLVPSRFVHRFPDNAACTYKELQGWISFGFYVSRHRTYFDIRMFTRRSVINARISLEYAALWFMESEYKCTQNMTNYLEGVNPIAIARDVPKGCYFFPELEEPAKAFALELHRNTSHGFDPPEEDFWKSENATEKYCEWLLEKVTDPEWMEEEDNSYGVVSWVLLLLFSTGSIFMGAAFGLTLGRRSTQEDSDAEEKSFPIVHHIYNEQDYAVSL